MYKVSDLLNPEKVPGRKASIIFVNACKDHLTNTKDQAKTRDLVSKLQKYENDIFLYEVDKLMNFDRRILETLSGSDNKHNISSDEVKNVIVKLSGIKKADIQEKDFYHFKESPVKLAKATTLKQEFVCYVIHYHFRNPQAKIYDILNHIQTNANLSIGELAKLNISKGADKAFKKFKVFGLDENYDYLVDAFGVAKTLTAFQSKINLKSGLQNYVVGEERSCNHLKDDPFARIKNTEKNYYDKPDKLTTADIFLYDTTHHSYKETRKIFTLRSNKLTHNQYRSYINKSFIDGAIIPISLKKLSNDHINTDLNSNFVTTQIKVIGSYNLGQKNKFLEDDFIKSAIRLFSTKDKGQFYKELNSMIDVKVDTARLDPTKLGTTINFDATWTPNKKTNYLIWMTVGQIHIMPKKTHSGSGLGGVSRESLFNDVITKLPKSNSYINSLIECRKVAFDNYFNTISKLKERKMLTGGKMGPASKSEFEMVFKEIPESDLYQYCYQYVIEMHKRMRRGVGGFTKQSFDKQPRANLAHKMSQYEMMFYLLAHSGIVKEWIQKSFIMSVYAAVSARGIIIFDGKHIDLKQFGRTAMESQSRVNPVYVKIGY
jgi:hypothetical protein